MSFGLPPATRKTTEGNAAEVQSQHIRPDAKGNNSSLPKMFSNVILTMQSAWAMKDLLIINDRQQVSPTFRWPTSQSDRRFLG